MNRISILVASALVTPALYAADLMQVYNQALVSDPIYAQAQSTWQSQKMNVSIARAGYLPQVGIAANADRDYVRSSSPISVVTGYHWQYGYGLTLTQPIFNAAAWASIQGAHASVKAATATYIAAQQSLMQRTATAYFSVLQAYDNLRYTIANKNAVWQQFATAREQFRVGLIAITDEYDARARYDQVVAQQILAQNNLNIQLENLRQITGRHYRSLKGLDKQLPLLRPKPDNIDQWVQVAEDQNYSIKAQNFTVQSAMETIKQQAAAGYPTLNLEGGYSDARTSDNSTGLPNTKVDQANLGLQLAYNPIQGGLVIASTKKARYNYVTASGLLDQTHRNVVNSTRSSFLSVLSFIGQVNADKQTIISSRNALSATEAGFKVGTRTMVDVLLALTRVYQSQQQYADDQYSYINNIIALKAAAGTLSVADLAEINSWLGKHIKLSQQTSVPRVSGDTGVNDKTQSLSTEKPIKPVKSEKSVKKKSVVTRTAVVQLEPPRQTMLPRPAAS